MMRFDDEVGHLLYLADHCMGPDNDPRVVDYAEELIRRGIPPQHAVRRLVRFAEVSAEVEWSEARCGFFRSA